MLCLYVFLCLSTGLSLRACLSTFIYLQVYQYFSASLYSHISFPDYMSIILSYLLASLFLKSVCVSLGLFLFFFQCIFLFGCLSLSVCAPATLYLSFSFFSIFHSPSICLSLHCLSTSVCLPKFVLSVLTFLSFNTSLSVCRHLFIDFILPVRLSASVYIFVHRFPSVF